MGGRSVSLMHSIEVAWCRYACDPWAESVPGCTGVLLPGLRVCQAVLCSCFLGTAEHCTALIAFILFQRLTTGLAKLGRRQQASFPSSGENVAVLVCRCKMSFAFRLCKSVCMLLTNPEAGSLAVACRESFLCIKMFGGKPQ